MSDCCEIPKITVNVPLTRLEVGNDVQTSSALVAPGIVMAKGDLLTLSTTNVLTLATTASNWDVIAPMALTAAQTTAHAAAVVQIPVYNQGEFNLDAVKIGGVLLTAAQKPDAQARGTIKNIELRKVVS